jgi:hypothetical protein
LAGQPNTAWLAADYGWQASDSCELHAKAVHRSRERSERPAKVDNFAINQQSPAISNCVLKERSVSFRPIFNVVPRVHRLLSSWRDLSTKAIRLHHPKHE